MAQSMSFTSMFANTDDKISPIAQLAQVRRNGAKDATDSPSLFLKRNTLLAEKAPATDDATSSTDGGDDIVPTYVDFSDFTSDSEQSEDCYVPSPCNSAKSTPTSLSTCVYSVMMLLHFRNAICDDEGDTNVLGYGTQARPASPPDHAASPKAVPTERARTASAADEAVWWRANPSDEEGSWRPVQEALPACSAESWVAAQRNGSPEEDDIVTRAARSILNKLTVEKFDALFHQLAQCGIKQPHHISILMHEIFEKATTQHHFIPMYADLCVRLEKDARIVAVVEDADSMHSFRRLLLNECQKVFEQLFEHSQCKLDVDEEAAFLRKQQALGNMKLIGHLLVHGMLSSDLFVGCCEELLKKRETSPDALESLVALMMVAGPKFDKDSWQYFSRLQKVFSEMMILTKEKSVAPRLRFLIRDVLDAREASWPCSPGCGKAAAPSKLEDVRLSAEALVSPDSKKEWTSIFADNKEEVQPEARDVKAAAPWRAKKVTLQIAPAEIADSAEEVVPADKPFSAVDFRRELNNIFKDLASDKNIPAAVQRVRAQNVPVVEQVDQYVDIMSRVVEERRGAVRRCELAFIAGLAANSAFEHSSCLAGIDLFFRDVYGGLCNEVHRLPAIMKSEFMPTMCNVLPVDELNKVVPTSMRK